MARRVLHDEYFRKAKQEGYLARSAYKLIEIDDRHHLIRKDDRVLDLGCSPGSWLQVLSQRVGDHGLVVGIDLKPVAGRMPANVRTVVGDFTEADPADLLPPDDPLRPDHFDAVVSDMAPNTSGHGDHFRSVRLCEEILDRLPFLLDRGGVLTMKVFDGEQLGQLLAHTRRLFNKAKAFKPRASREISRELFIVAGGYRPPRDRDGDR